MVMTTQDERVPHATPTTWSTVAMRREIEPAFARRISNDSAINHETLIISTDHREGLHGRWVGRVPVQGGCKYRFTASRKTSNVPYPRRSAYATVAWEDDKGQPVLRNNQSLFAADTFLSPTSPAKRLARAEYPRDTGTDSNGQTRLSGIFTAPSDATVARIDLHLRWASHASVEWTEVSLTPVTGHQPRTATLAAINLWPEDDEVADTPAAACQLFVNGITKAASQGADLVCLPEGLTHSFTQLPVDEVAESIPGPSTAFFGEQAKQHDLYVVAGLYERDGHLLYNTAALIGPDGSLIGKYRKVCLTSDEGCVGHLVSGDEFPVFDTRFGKMGLMICWDLQFPEVARELSYRGAEVIAVPVAGMNPVLASARAIENQVYLVMSSYASKTRKHWLKTGIVDYDGTMIAVAEERGTVAVATVELGDEARHWANIGDFKGRVERTRPIRST